MGDQISVGDIINAEAIAIGREAIAVKTTGDVTIYKGPTYPRLDYRNEISDLVSYYTQTFVGRTAEVQQLTHFAAQESSGYLLVEALPGYGKSALMFHLLHRYESGSWDSSRKPYLLYFFIRQQGKRNTPVAFLQALNSQLLEILNLPGGVPTDLDALRSQFSQLWVRALDLASSEQPLLLLVDGLDEMSVGDVTIANLLPSKLTSYSHVIVSSRPNPQPLEQVSLEHPFRKASVIRLQIFSESDIRALLEEFNASAEVAANLSPRVLTMTKGEPLFARFVCQEVVAKGESALLRLEQNPPTDVEAYFRQQFKQLDTLTEDDQGEIAWEILGLLVVTLGGITIEEMAEVLDERQRRVRKAVDLIKRFLLGDPRFILMHLQLRKVLTEEFSSREQAKYRQQLLDWCRSYQEQDWPKETPGYVLAYYAEHLSAVGHKEALYALINKRWMDAQFERTYSYRAFAEDVALAIKVANSETPPPLVQQLRNYLIYTTLGSLATNVPPEILGALAQVGETTKAQGYASLIQEKRNQSFAYLLIGEALLAKDEEKALEILLKALESAELIGQESWEEKVKAEVLSRVATALVQLGNEDGLNQMMNIALTIQDEESKIQAWSGVVQGLVELQDKAGLNRALAAAEAIDPLWTKIKVLSRVSQALAQVGELDQVLALLELTEPQEARALLLNGVTQGLATAKDKDGLNRVWAVVETIQYLEPRATVLGEIAKAWAEVGEFNRALAVAEAMEDEFYGHYKAEAMSAVAQSLVRVGGKSKLSRVLTVVEGISNENSKAKALSTIAQALVQSASKDDLLLVAAAVEAVKDNELWNGEAKAEALGSIAEAMAKLRDKEGVLRILALVEQIGSEHWWKRETLWKVAPVLTVIGESERALAVVEAIEDDDFRKANALSCVAQALGQLEDKDRLNQALVLAETLKEWKDIALTGIAQGLTQVSELDQALALVERITNAIQKVEALSGVIHVLVVTGDRQALNHVLVVAEAMKDENFGDRRPKLMVLSQLAEAFAKLGDKQSLNRILEALEAIGEEEAKVKALRAITQALVEVGKLDQALAVVGTLRKSQADGIRRIAETLAEAGNYDGLSRVLTAAATLSNKREQEDAVDSVGIALTKAGQFDQALAIAEAMKNEFSKAYRLRGLAQALAKVEDRQRLNRVLEVAEAMRPGRDRSIAISEVVQVLAQVGELDRVLALAVAIPDELSKADALCEVIKALALVGDKEGLNRALVAVETIEDEEYKTQALAGVVRVLARMGNKDGLNRVLAMAEAIKDSEPKSNALSQVALELVAGGELDWGLAVFGTLRNTENRSDALYITVKFLVQTQEFDQALKTAQMIGDRWSEYKSAALSSVAQALAQLGKKERAATIADQAWAATKTVVRVKEKIFAQRKVAQAFAQVSKLDQALDVVQNVVYGYRATALSEVAEILAQEGDRDGMSHVLAVAETISDGKERADALSGVAQAIAKMTDKDGLNRVLKAAKVIEGERERAYALSWVAQSLVQVGDQDGLSQALAAVNSIRDAEARANALRRIAQSQSQLGHKEKSLQVFQSALNAASLVGRESFFGLLEDGASTLAAIDEGNTLWHTFEAVIEVDSWLSRQ